jgi:hypothetical protein
MSSGINTNVQQNAAMAVAWLAGPAQHGNAVMIAGSIPRLVQMLGPGVLAGVQDKAGFADRLCAII